jgi:hypothetical protein
VKVLIQSYGSGAYNKEVEDTSAISYKIDHLMNGAAEATIVIEDPTGSKAQQYMTIDTNKNVGAAVADDGGVQTTETTEANEATADDMTLLPATPAVNDAYYIGFDESWVGGFTLNVTTAGVGTWTITWEYSQGSSSWAALSGVTDGTTGFTVAGENDVTWTVPADWATDTVNSITGKYWVRGRVSAYTTVNAQPLGGQAWYDRVYIGPAKVTIEDPDSTDLFLGRIMEAESNTSERTVTLKCQDWISQLDEEQITYDMREDLDGAGLRQSELYGDADNGTHVGVAYTSGTDYYVYDDDMSWSADQFNGAGKTSYFILGDGMAGVQNWKFWPYTASVTNGSPPTGDGDFEVLWVDDSNTAVITETGGGSDFEVQYDFRVYLGHNTPSDFYVHDSVTDISVAVNGKFNASAGETCYVKIYDDTGSAWVVIGEIDNDNTISRQRYDFGVPEYYASRVVNSSGIVKVMFDVSSGAAVI